MTAALRAEWTKLRTLAGTGWLLVGAVVLTIGGQRRGRRRYPLDHPADRPDPTKLALTGIYLGQAVVAVLAVWPFPRSTAPA